MCEKAPERKKRDFWFFSSEKNMIQFRNPFAIVPLWRGLGEVSPSRVSCKGPCVNTPNSPFYTHSLFTTFHSLILMATAGLCGTPLTASVRGTNFCKILPTIPVANKGSIIIHNIYQYANLTPFRRGWGR